MPIYQAFIFNSAVAARRARQRNADIEYKKHHIPMVTRAHADDDAPPVLVAVVGPPGVGKTTLMKSLIKHYTGHSVPNIQVRAFEIGLNCSTAFEFASFEVGMILAPNISDFFFVLKSTEDLL